MAQTGPRDKATIEALKQRMARDPLSRAFLQLAEEYRKAGRFEEAVQVCNEGLARHPGYHTARIALGRTYLDAGDLENAHRALIEVLDGMPENHLAAKLLAEVQLRLGNRQGAAETYRAILSHYPGDREVEGLLNQLGGGGEGTTPAGALAAAGHPTRAGAAPAGPDRSDQTPAPLEVVEGGGPPSGALEDDEDMAAVAGALPSIVMREELRTGEHAMDRPSTAGHPETAIGFTGETRPLLDPAADAAVGDPGGRDALQTNTLAELYLRQGLVEKAIDVYRAMLRVDQGNEQARRRLQELTGSGEEGVGPPLPKANPGLPPTVGPPPTVDWVAPEAGSARINPRGPTEAVAGAGGGVPSGSSEPEDDAGEDASTSVHPREPVHGAAATIARLERWLMAIRAASPPAGGAASR